MVDINNRHASISDKINKLPDCVLLKIFKTLQHVTSEIWRARIVCKRWYVLLADSELWRVCNLSNFKLNDANKLEEVMSYLPIYELRYMEAANNELSTDVLNIFLQRTTKLQGIRLNGCTIKPREKGFSSNCTPSGLELLDVRKCTGDLEFIHSCLINNGKQIKVFGISSNFGDLVYLNQQSFFAYLPNLTILDCYDCLWMNDLDVLNISNYCKELISLNLKKCLSIHGTTIVHLLSNCKMLKTLVLQRTSLENGNILHIDWNDCGLTELDLSHCYFLEDEVIAPIVTKFATKLKYLRCSVTDQLVSEIMAYKLNFESLDIRRRHPVNIENIAIMLSNSQNLTALDVSLTPMSFELIKMFLPKLTNLVWLSFGGNDILKTDKTLIMIANKCLRIREVGVNYYQAHGNKALHDGLVYLIYSARNLHKICLAGVYMQDTIKKVETTLSQSEGKKTNALFSHPKNFKFPQPRSSLNSSIKVFSNAFVPFSTHTHTQQAYRTTNMK